MTESVTLRTVLGRSLRRLCPSCGRDKVFIGLLRVKERCGVCGFNCRPEGGYYLGAIYINYGLTAVLALGPGFWLTIEGRPTAGLIIALAVGLLFPLLFFQLSRSLWLGIDMWITRNPGGR
ncbi:MAG TPA: DUF983 domain-containing protein [Planctomycetota bacterium]|nr:DUF983 domain-containing protein [Planctomycetota bacterium]